MFEYTGIVAEITGNFRFVLVDIETKCEKKFFCDVNHPYIKTIVNLLEIGDTITIKGEIVSSNVKTFNKEMIAKVDVFEIIG